MFGAPGACHPPLGSLDSWVWLDRDEAGGKVDGYQGWRIVMEAGVVGARG